MPDLPVCDLFDRHLPANTVASGGRPAPIVPYGGMPAYESERGAFAVMECLVCQISNRPDARFPMCLPRSYGMASLRAPTGMTALHDDPGAVWSWRPLLYHLMYSHTEQMGSQGELAWRWGLHETQMVSADLGDEVYAFVVRQAQAAAEAHDGIPFDDLPDETKRAMHDAYVEYVTELNERPLQLPFVKANARADRLLREHLNPQQRIDLEANNCFYVQGVVNRLYCVRLGNGAAVVHPETRAEVLSLCLHPEEWIPDADVALATKLLIDAGRDGEAELLEGARATSLRARTRPSAVERAAWERERDLLPRASEDILQP